MKKTKDTKSHKSGESVSRSKYGLGGSGKSIYGLDVDFILIVGGAFVLIILGIILFAR